MATMLGIRPGVANFYLKRLVYQGYISGFVEKSRLTYQSK